MAIKGFLKQALLVLLGIMLAGRFLTGMAYGSEKFNELCSDGTIDQVQAAIKAGADVNAKDQYGFTPLMAAAGSNTNPEVTTALLKAGADTSPRASMKMAGREGFTALMLAAEHNASPSVVRALLEAGADINAKDDDGLTPLMYAVISQSGRGVSTTIRIIEVLVEAGADVNAKSKRGQTALDMISYGQVERTSAAALLKERTGK